MRSITVTAAALAVIVAGLAGPAAAHAASPTVSARVTQHADDGSRTGRITAGFRAPAGAELVGKPTFAFKQGRKVVRAPAGAVRAVKPGRYKVTVTGQWRTKARAGSKQVQTGTEFDVDVRTDVPCTLTSGVDNFEYIGGGSGYATCQDPLGVYPDVHNEFVYWDSGSRFVGDTVTANSVLFSGEIPTYTTVPVYRYGPVVTTKRSFTIAVKSRNTKCASRAEYNRIRKGQTLSQVRSIFGGGGKHNATVGDLSSYTWEQCSADAWAEDYHVSFDRGRVYAFYAL